MIALAWAEAAALLRWPPPSTAVPVAFLVMAPVAASTTRYLSPIFLTVLGMSLRRESPVVVSGLVLVRRGPADLRDLLAHLGGARPGGDLLSLDVAGGDLHAPLVSESLTRFESHLVRSNVHRVSGEALTRETMGEPERALHRRLAGRHLPAIRSRVRNLVAHGISTPCVPRNARTRQAGTNHCTCCHCVSMRDTIPRRIGLPPRTSNTIPPDDPKVIGEELQ